MTILGFDPSLTSSGFSYTDMDGDIHTGRIVTKDLRGVERLAFIRDSFLKILYSTPDVKVAPFTLIAYEGYSMGGFGKKGQRGRFFDMGELGGVLKLIAIERGFDILLVPPTNLKQFATESGGHQIKKPQITAAIAKLWGYNVKQNDEADAFVLMKMGEAVRNRRKHRTYSAIRRGALEKCQLIKGQK